MRCFVNVNEGKNYQPKENERQSKIFRTMSIWIMPCIYAIRFIVQPKRKDSRVELVSPRQSDILKLARKDGRVYVEELAEKFTVSPQTVRKDLNELCEKGMLQRVHGGAVLASGVTNFAYEARRVLAADEKRLIGLKTASLIPDNSSLLINIGTTTEQVALALIGHKGLLVITNNINVVNILRNDPELEVIVAGGLVRISDGGIVGESAVENIQHFKVDYAVIGASAIDPDGSIMDYDYREVRVAQAIIENARHTILVADGMKFERTAPVRIGHISQLDTFVTNRVPPPAISRICRENDVKIELATTKELYD
jgi:DeoR family glycerol-3-phosphate regulon repressor